MNLNLNVRIVIDGHMDKTFKADVPQIERALAALNGKPVPVDPKPFALPDLVEVPEVKEKRTHMNEDTCRKVMGHILDGHSNAAISDFMGMGITSAAVNSIRIGNSWCYLTGFTPLPDRTKPYKQECYFNRNEHGGYTVRGSEIRTRLTLEKVATKTASSKRMTGLMNGSSK